MDPNAYQVPAGPSPPPRQALPATLKQLLGVGEQELVPDARRRSNTLIFTVLGTLTLLMFGLANVRAGQDQRLMVMGVVQLLEVAFLLVPAIILISRRAPPVLSENMLVLAGFAIFASNVVFGGQTGDSPYWTFVFPYLVFFLRGQKTGWLVGVAFALLVPGLMLYSSRHWNFWNYGEGHCLYYGLAYLFNVVTAAYFNLLRSRFQAHLADQVEYHTGEVHKHMGTLQYNALHDLSTGLLNRQGLTERLESSLSPAIGVSGYLLVAHVRFFRVPELASIVGTAKVDQSLGQLGRVLQQHLAGLVGLARVGQDTLGIAMQSDTADAAAIEPLRAIAHLRDVTRLSEFAVHVEMAFGVVAQRLDEAADAEELMRNAEQALLFAIDHRQEYQFFDNLLHKHFVDRNRRYEKLREAILQDTLMLHYQPQVDLKTGRVVGAEALARWNDPQEGMIPPDKFIPIIESTGLLHRFSVWTVSRALRDCATWQSRLPGVSVSVNLSADALHDPEVLQTVERQLLASGMAPALVVMELTESVLLTSPEAALEAMARFVALGVQLSIDDYGAGFSSLTYLKQLPAQEMKIDKSFMENLAEGSKDRAIVLSSIELGHDLGLKVLAEGIEDEATCQVLRDAGCDLGQGWWFAKAMPSTEFEQWAVTRNHTVAKPSGRERDY
ncbi:bifunctional diguanylate cyclase/phosphodiesterase [Rhodoferax sp.]|uniref:putative bifunctional diguanylate cyclase/phosphodiesterase n=1 Tax=Rhodoferax sp. TaxID=50421 RepID=UPI0025F5434D|nr:bifunctional diguanylate cyclase/phosphodiesterase [Rhodoferax sp.]